MYGIMSAKLKVHTEWTLRWSYWLVLDKRFLNESVMLACPIHMDNLKRNKTIMASYVHLENKNTFYIIHSNLLLLNLQKCQIILIYPVYDPPVYDDADTRKYWCSLVKRQIKNRKEKIKTLENWKNLDEII